MKFLWYIIPVLLVPFCIAGTAELFLMISGLDLLRNLWFLFGGCCFLFMHFYIGRMTRFFIYQHELTHAFFSLITGGEFRSLKVHASGGQVKVTNPGIIVALAPYIFPFFPFLLVFAYYVLYSVNPVFFGGLRSFFLFLFGFLVFFHFIFTYISLKNEQPDLSLKGSSLPNLKKNGYLVSLVMIYAVNILLLAAITKTADPANLSVRNFLKGWLFRGAGYYGYLYKTGASLLAGN